MRIFYAASDSGDAVGLKGSKAWYYNLYLPLVDIGNEVIRFDYDLTPHFRNLDPSKPKHKAFIDKNRPRLEEELLKQIRRAHLKKPINLFFSYFYSACCSPEVIKEISKMGILAVNWYCNASYQFHLVREIAPAYDYCLVPEKFKFDDYKKVGAHPIYLQEAANPNIYKPYNLPKKYEVTFIGQRYGDRAEYIQYLLDRGIDVRVWGPGWKRKVGLRGLLFEKMRDVKRTLLNQPRIKDLQQISKRPIVNIELVKMFSRSKINLGFSSCGETHRTEKRILQIRLRDFEIPMSGGFYMVEYMEELQEFFEIGKEIVCYTDPQDLADKIKYYLKHDSKREAIRKAGYERCQREHTWQKRFEMAFKEMGLGI